MKILQLSHYTTANPTHGGQIRCSEIAKKLRLLGHTLRSLSISFSAVDANDKYDLVLSLFAKDFYSGVVLIDDLVLSCLCKENEKIYNFFLQHLKEFQPDIILIEQPWLWPIVARMIEHKILQKNKTKIIYSSHNIEFTLKEDILLRWYNGQEEKKSIIDTITHDIRMLEEDLAKNADGIICVTQTDADWMKTLINNTPIIVANNGVKEQAVASTDSTKISQVLQNMKFALFIGSAHPPNMHGFWDMLGPSLANFPPDTMIIAAGGCSTQLYDYAPKESSMYLLVNQKILKCLGYVSNEILPVLIAEAECIILPITMGGGSNLKTAEAIAACKPVVATSIACRGFDFARELSNFYIYDDQRQFSRMVVRILTGKQPILEISNQEHVLRASVYWEQALLPLDDLVKELSKN